MRRLLDGLDVVELEEEEEERDAPSFNEPLKHWHAFHAIARRP